MVAERRQELVEQVAVGGVDLDHAEAGVVGALRRLDERLLQPVDAGDVERFRRRIIVGEGLGAGRERCPAAGILGHLAVAGPGAVGAGLAAGVRQLDAGDRALLVDEMRGAGERLEMPVAPDTQVLWGDAAFRRDRGGFGEDQAGAADGAAGEMHEVPVVRHALAGGILAHGRDADAVAKGDLAQAELVKQVRHGGNPSVDPS